jgi:hypothetical protein
MGLQITWTPSVRKTSSKLETYFESRSLMRKRKRHPVAGVIVGKVPRLLGNSGRVRMSGHSR